jgi:pimeloyl-ACP methyl ester carboxylesterase
MDKPTLLSRRQYLRAMLAAGALSPSLLLLAGCGSTQLCPDDPAESGGVDWTPDILHPMFWGFQDLDVASGAPGSLRIYYPTYEGTPQNALILKLCLIRFPVVLFMHGQPPCPDPNYFKRWQILGTVLARSGYVVVMPKHNASTPVAGSPDIGVGLAALDFVRNAWEHRNWVDSDVTATTVVGHSFGALLAARIHQARPTIGAYVGLSGVWTEVTDTIPLLQSIQVPAFFSWATLAGPVSESMNGGLWQAVPGPKWAAFFPGLHFDYISPFAGCSFQRGSCDLIELVMAELVALFVSRQVPVKTSRAPIPGSLIPPAVTLTPKQAFFAGAHLNGIGLIESRQDCGIDLRWEDPLDTGSRHLGP